MSVTAEQRLEFRQRGFVVIDTELADEELDAVVADLAPFWGPERVEPEGAAMADGNRIQDYWPMSPHVHAVATTPVVLDALRELYGREPRPFQTLNFHRGTEQKVHSDSIHFNSEPFGLMCGVWVALEDIGLDQGPLVYYPGSQDLPEMNFEDFGLRPSYDVYPEYELALERFIAERRLQPEYGELRKGQALVWAANLFHGGSTQHDKTLTRQSQVTHYYFAGARPWRPGHSEHGRAYFEPEWIPPTWSPPRVPRPPSLYCRVRSRIGRLRRRVRR